MIVRRAIGLAAVVTLIALAAWGLGALFYSSFWSTMKELALGAGGLAGLAALVLIAEWGFGPDKRRRSSEG